jgi:Zn-dependent protease
VDPIYRDLREPTREPAEQREDDERDGEIERSPELDYFPTAPDPRDETVDRGYEPVQPKGFDWRKGLRTLWAPIALLIYVLAKFKGVLAALFKLKLFTVLGSAFVSVAAYALIWGWYFAIGFVVLLFVHELGHVAVAKTQGLKVSAPLFIPFMGAMIAMREMPQNAWREAQLALGGPLLGTAGAVACWAMGAALDSDLLRALAYVGFLINLFNLIPVVPLDGGRAIGAVHPVFWLVGVVILGVAAVVWLSPFVLVIVLLLGGAELWSRGKSWWQNRGTAGNRYYEIAAWQRVVVGAVYVGLAAFLFWAMSASQVAQDRL